MRLLTFELLAYGPFTEKRLDLSEGKAGLHLIYGPNEAGKSVALRALTNLLFGIPPRTSDNFLHDFPMATGNWETNLACIQRYCQSGMTFQASLG